MLQFAGCVHPSILGLSSTNICPYGLGVKRKCTSEFQDQRILAVIITHATPKVIEWSWMLSLLGKTCQDPPVWLDLSKNESAVLSFRKYGKYFIKKTWALVWCVRSDQIRTNVLFVRHTCCVVVRARSFQNILAWTEGVVRTVQSHTLEFRYGVTREFWWSIAWVHLKWRAGTMQSFKKKIKNERPMNMTESHCLALYQLRESNALNLRIWPVV